MRTCRVPAVIMAVVIGGVGLAACGTSASPSAAGSSSAATSGSPASGATSTPASSATTPTQSNSAATQPASTPPTHIGTTPYAPPSSTDTKSGSHSFTVPSISGDNVVSAWGSYQKIGTARVKVDVCAKQTGTAFAVGAVALVYSAGGSSQNIGATDLNGPGDQNCVTNTFILYTAHLKVHAFIGGSGGTIVKTGPVLTLY
jgi:hypothetical protein